MKPAVAVIETSRITDPGAFPSETEEPSDGLIHEVRWPTKDRRSTPALAVDGLWLVFADSGGLGRELQSRLEAGGATCHLIYPEVVDEPGALAVDPADPEGFRRLLADAAGGIMPRGVIHLWGLDAAKPERATVAEVEAAQVRGCGSVLHLVQALAGIAGPASPRLWIATRGSQPVGPDPVPAAVLPAPLWGMGRSIALEHPGLWGGLIDLDPAAAGDEAAMLLGEVTAPDGEDQVAFRRGLRHVARLVRHAAPEEPVRPLALRPEGTYLVTGGLGALGLRAARWLAERGARRLVLVGRSGLPGARPGTACRKRTPPTARSPGSATSSNSGRRSSSPPRTWPTRRPSRVSSIACAACSPRSGGSSTRRGSSRRRRPSMGTSRRSWPS